MNTGGIQTRRLEKRSSIRKMSLVFLLLNKRNQVWQLELNDAFESIDQISAYDRVLVDFYRFVDRWD